MVLLFFCILSFLFPFEMANARLHSEPAPALVGIQFQNAKLANDLLQDVHLSNGLLLAKLKGQLIPAKKLIGAILLGQDDQLGEIPIRIHDVSPDEQDPEIFYYELEYWRNSTSQWENICAPDRYGQKKAVLVAGVWDTNGAHRTSHSLFTVGCTSSAVGKCVSWGYKPWKVVKGQSLEALHHACTRMVRADYLGDGRAHTREGVKIHFQDFLGIHSEPFQKMTREATWDSRGAISVYKLRQNDLGEKAMEIPWHRKDAGLVLLTSYSK